jgi:hypothetical protein
MSAIISAFIAAITAIIVAIINSRKTKGPSVSDLKFPPISDSTEVLPSESAVKALENRPWVVGSLILALFYAFLPREYYVNSHLYLLALPIVGCVLMIIWPRSIDFATLALCPAPVAVFTRLVLDSIANLVEVPILFILGFLWLAASMFLLGMVRRVMRSNFE